MKSVGWKKAIPELKNPKGKFVYKDLYVFITDLDGFCLIHPIMHSLAGKNQRGIKDADGKFFIKEQAQIAKAKGSGTVIYRWPNPQTKKIEQKETYFEVVDREIIVNCGYYKL